jgi:HSP20 family protein
MAIGDITPWKWGGLRALQERRPFESLRGELDALHRNLDRAFESIWSEGFGTSLLGDVWGAEKVVPRLDLTEDEKAVHVSVELPGMDEKDVAVSLSDRLLTIRGEKKEEKETKEKDVYRRERAYGSFRRTLELPIDIDATKIEARFRNGVLTIDLPKTKEAQEKVIQIPVKAA